MDAVIVNVVTDGLGGFQARCTRCTWRSAWFERDTCRKNATQREALAAQAAREHGTTHVEVKEAP